MMFSCWLLTILLSLLATRASHDDAHRQERDLWKIFSCLGTLLVGLRKLRAFGWVSKGFERPPLVSLFSKPTSPVHSRRAGSGLQEWGLSAPGLVEKWARAMDLCE
jgi:hypothetical protein